MGDARTVTVDNLKTRFNYELRNSDQEQWEAAETLEYVNKWLEMIHAILLEHESELVCTGTGEITLVAGTDEYSLSSNDMGDLVYIPGGETSDTSRVRLEGLQALTLGRRSDRMAHLIEKDNGTTSYSQPSEYYIHAGNICVLPFPDSASTAYALKIEDYAVDYTTITAVTETVPYYNIFNNVLVEGVKIIAKNRESDGSAVDSALMELFQDRAMSILRKRQKQDYGLTY